MECDTQSVYEALSHSHLDFHPPIDFYLVSFVDESIKFASDLRRKSKNSG